MFGGIRIPVKYTVPNCSDFDNLQNGIKKIIKSKQLHNGPYTLKLEEKILELYDIEYALACSSCSQGLVTSIYAMRKQHLLDTCFIPAFTWPSTSLAAEVNNLDIKFVGINPQTYHMNLKQNRFYGLAIPVHVFGSTCVIDNCAHIIYDAAHSLGAKIEYFGDATVFSMSPSKLATAGEGGIIVTNDTSLYDRMRIYRDKMCKIPEISAYIGLKSLKSLDYNVKKRKQIAKRYKSKLNGIHGISFQSIPFDTNYYVFSMTMQYQIKFELLKLFNRKKIEYKCYFEPLAKLPSATVLYDHSVCLPIHSQLNNAMQDIVIDCIKEAVKKVVDKE